MHFGRPRLVISLPKWRRRAAREVFNINFEAPNAIHAHCHLPGETRTSIGERSANLSGARESRRRLQPTRDAVPVAPSPKAAPAAEASTPLSFGGQPSRRRSPMEAEAAACARQRAGGTEPRLWAAKPNRSSGAAIEARVRSREVRPRRLRGRQPKKWAGRASLRRRGLALEQSGIRALRSSHVHVVGHAV